MNLEQVEAILAQHEGELWALGVKVKSLAVFGSVARGEARPDSDVDLLVEFDRPIGLFHFAGVQRRLAQWLGVEEVDLVLRDSVIEELKEKGIIYFMQVQLGNYVPARYQPCVKYINPE